MDAGRPRFIRAGNGGQGATASLASTATPALWNLQLAQSKGGTRVRIPLSPPPFVLCFQLFTRRVEELRAMRPKLVFVSAEITFRNAQESRDFLP
jgi:hypothetical protein